MEFPAGLSAILQRIAQIEGAPPLAADPPAFEPALPRTGSNDRFQRLIDASAAKYGVDSALVKAIVANESGFDPGATSPSGAQGLMQLEPATAAGLGVSDPYDPVQNINGGTRYLRGLLDRFHGNMPLALAGYNAGPYAVEKYGGVPPYAETQAYVEAVLRSYRRYKQR
ncbi:MAG TPA: lytic transglycosylase domain-containing protein [Candidatus Rubrimentiphilum sp.]|nr:lytic transglycosylase domain-containing protein [Candidatus Rubrimentiphilum sp.]